MLTVGRHLFFVLVCAALLELTSGAMNCTIPNPLTTLSQITCSVWENVPDSTLVFNATVLDSRFTSDLRYDLSSIDGDGRAELAFAQHFDTLSVHIPSRLSNGQLRTRGVIDRENMSLSQDSRQPVSWAFYLTIYASPRVTYVLQINVIDINDNAPTFTPSVANITSIEGDRQNVSLDEYVPSARDPDEEHNGVQNYSLEDNHEGLFTLRITLMAGEDIIRLLSTRPLDREEQPSYSLVLIAVDSGNKTGRLDVTVTLTDVNDNIPVVGETSYTVHIEENSDIGQPVININATDDDSGSYAELTYSINAVVDDIGEDVTGENVFNINAGSGEISTNVVLDRERVSYYRLIVLVRDGGNRPNSVLVTVAVQVVDVNDNAPAVSIDLNQQISGKVSESLQVGTSIATMTVTDPDEGENGLFNISHLEDLNDENGLSQIEFRQNFPQNNTWDLVLVTSLDRETREDYDLQVMVMDRGRPPLGTTYNFSFSIHDENDNAPIFNTSYSVSVSEGVRIGATVVENIQAYDRDIGTNGNLTYSLSPASSEFPHQELFTIHPVVGNLIVAATLDREATSELDIEVIATDMGGDPMSGRTSVHLVLTDVNDNAPVFAPDTMSQTRVHENLSARRIYTFSATDLDEPPYANVTYFISHQTGSYFRIDPVSGELFTNASLDREEFANHTIQIGATDNENMNFINFTILVDDVNDVPPTFDTEAYFDSIPENVTIDTVVTVLTVIDPDLNNGLRFAIESGNDEGKFSVNNPSGEVVVVSSLDRETTESYTLIINVTDGAGLAATNRARVVITVLDINDHPPQFNQSHYEFYVTEESETTTIGAVLATSDDIGHNAIVSYEITGGNRDGYFTINPNSGVITARQGIDRESNEMFELRITAQDGTDPIQYNTTTVTVLVRDINDNSPIFNPANVTVSLREDHSLNQVFYTASAVDTDEGNNANTTYSIVSSSNGEFLINAATGGLSLVSTLDYETVTSVLVIIQAVDSRRSDFTSRLYLNISVEDIDDRLPRFPSDFPTSLTVNESVSSRSVILTFQAITSPTSPANHFNYMLSNHMNNFTLFTLNDNASLEVVSLDREQRSQYNLNITIINIVANLSNSKVLNIIVSDTNDNPPVFSSPPYSFNVMENSVGAHVGTVEAGDNDDGINSMVRFSIQGASDLFQIDRESGAIKTLASLDYDTVQEHSLVVWATDMGTPSMSTSTTVSISVIDVNDNPPVFSTNQMYEFRVSEDAPIEATVGNLEATDDDSGDFGAITYSIQAGDEGNHFRIVHLNGNRGSIIVNKMLDRESTNEYRLIVSATDNNNRPDFHRIQRNFTITILDVNDNAPVFSDTQVYTIAVRENEPANLIATISAEDTDIGTNARVNFMLGSGNYRDSFLIDHSTGALRTRRTLDYEMNTFYPLEIIAYDNGSPRKRSVRIFNITVTNVNDHTPYFTLQSYQFTLREESSSSSTTIRVHAEDGDSGLMGEVTYRILSQSPSNYFDIDSTSGVIRPLVVLDYEQYSEYTLMVEASDRDPTVLNRRVNQTTVLIVLENINDNRPSFLNLPHTIRLSEAVSTNTVTYVASAVDTDTDTLRYSITGGNQDNKFMMNSQTGEVFVASSLDRDDVSRYDMAISVTDGLTEVTAMLYVIVEDVNDNSPVFAHSPYTVNVSEGSNVGDVVGRIIATDADEGFNAQLEFSLVEASEYFAIESSSGNLTLLLPLDRDNDSMPSLITLRVRVTDMGIINRNTNVTSVQVFITDVNDSPPIFTRPTFRFTIPRDFSVGETFGVINATDRDEGTNAEHLFSIVVSPDGLNLFNLNRTSGEFSLMRSLGAESLPVYQIRVRVVDLRNSMLEDFASVEVIVTDTNDHPPQFPKEKYSIDLMESLMTPQSVLILTATDDDTGSNGEIRYQFGEAQSHFTINQSTGNIVVTDSLDHERVPVFTLLIYAINRNGRNSSTILNVNVLDVNDNVPRFQDLPSSLTISEVPFTGLEILHVNAVDPDGGSFGQVSYSLITEAARSQFNIDSVTGIVTNLVELTADDTYTLEFEATDGGGNSSRMTITLTVADHSSQSPNFNTPAASVMVHENFPINTAIHQFNASNQLVSPVPIKYRISNYTDGVFALNETTGELSLLQSLDFEQVQAYHFVIEAYQDVPSTRYSSYLEVVVLVQDVNDNAPVFTNPYVVAMNIRESIGMNSEVATVHAVDEESENSFRGVTYEITDGNVGGVFSIGPTNGQIVVVRSLDRESVDAYRLVVTATDEGTPPLSATAIVAISVLDVNDVTPSFRNASYTFRVSENSTLHSIVGVVSAVDPDLTPVQLVYSLRSLTASLDGRLMPEVPLTHFEMNQTSGAILLNHNLDRALLDRYELEITVTDGRNDNSTSVVIIVEDSNNNRPIFGALLYAFSIPELSDAGAPVFQLTASDADVGHNGIVRYRLGDDWPSGLFSIDSLTGIVTLLEPAPLYQASSNGVWVTGTVIASDLGSVPQSSSATVTISLFDINNHSPSLMQRYSSSVFDISLVGSTVMNITASDQDQGANAEVSYYISYPEGPISIPFEIDRTTGKITVSGGLSPSIITFKVIAVNENPDPFAAQFILSSTATVEVTVNGMNIHTPQFNQSLYEAQVLESEERGTNIVQVDATDGDNNAISYSIQSSDVLPFTINANGLISINGELDREENDVYNIVIVATDNGVPPKSAIANVRINVLDVNDNKPEFDKDLFEISVMENVQIGTEVTVITANDRDLLENSQITYALNDTSVFRIDSGTGRIVTQGDIDREAVAIYYLEITATDNGNPVQSSSAVVLVSVDGENESPPVFNTTETVFTVDNGLAAGAIVGRLYAYDGDKGREGELKFTFFGYGEYNPNDYFYINSSGFIILNVTSRSDRVDSNTVSTSRRKRQATDPSTDSITVETGVRVEDSGTNPSSDVIRITIYLPNEYVELSRVVEESPESSPIVVVVAAVCSAVVLAVVVLIVVCVVCHYRRRRDRNKLYSPSALSETESNRLSNGTFTPTNANGIIHGDSHPEASGTRLTAVPEAPHAQVSTTSDSEPASGIFGDDESESVLGMQSRTRANNPEHVSPSGRHRSPQHSRPPPISRSTSDLAAVVNSHNSNGFLRRTDDEEAHPYTRDQLIAIYAANANLLTNSPSQDSIHMFGSEGGGEADGDIDMDNYMFAKFGGGLDSADEESVVGINNDAYTVSSRGRSSIASRSSGGGIDEGGPDDLWRGSRTSGFRPHRVTDVIDEMHAVLSQESLSQSKEKRKPKPSPHMLQFQETSFTKKPTSGSYTRHTGSMQNVRYPDHVGNSQYEGYDRRSSKSQSQSHYASSGAIYPLSYSSRASELTLPPYRAGEAPPPYANDPIRPVNPPEMRRDSQSSDSDSSEYPAPNPPVTSYGPQPVSPQPSLPTTNSTISLDNPIFQSPLYGKHYKAAKGAIPHPHSGSVPQINMYNAGSVHGSHGSIGQGMDRQQRYNVNNGNLRA